MEKRRTTATKRAATKEFGKNTEKLDIRTHHNISEKSRK